MAETTLPRVVIAGGGVAALETLIALRDLAGDRVDITLVAPEESFTYRPMTVAAPFSMGHANRYGLARIATEFDARIVQDAIHEVRSEEQVVLTVNGSRIPYDHLVLAIGARATPAYERAITFGEDVDEQALHGLLRDTEEGYVDRVAFVVPNETTWALPLYELALMTARQAWSMGADRVRFLLVTSEERPLAMFGAAASDAVAELLGSAAIEFIGSTYTEVEHNCLILDPGGRSIDVDRVVSLPRLEGRRIAGVPADAEGFIPVDTCGRVAGLPGVYAAGDGTAFPIKQGGLATQQADAVAGTIAAAAGAPVEPQPFKPVLRGLLLTGGDNRFMRSGIAGGQGDSDFATHALWWPPAKIASRYLAPFLFGRDEVATIERLRGDHLAVEADFATTGHAQDARIAVS
jgi:sulfide:quinone oxidoreductase